MSATMSGTDVTLLGERLGSLDAAIEAAVTHGNTFVCPMAVASVYTNIALKSAHSFLAVTDRVAEGTFGGVGPPPQVVSGPTHPVFFDTLIGDDFVYRGAKIVPYGLFINDPETGLPNTGATFSMRMYGWSLFEAAGFTSFWHPILLAEVQCTLSEDLNTVPPPSTLVSAYCDLITLVGTSGNEGISCEIVAPQNGTPAHLVVILKGSRYLEIQFSIEGGGSDKAQKASALVSFF